MTVVRWKQRQISATYVLINYALICMQSGDCATPLLDAPATLSPLCAPRNYIKHIIPATQRRVIKECQQFLCASPWERERERDRQRVRARENVLEGGKHSA